jgi:hypothetical protein
MVEKKIDFDGAIIVEASGSYADHHQGDGDYRTVGATIQLLEAKLAEAGIIISNCHLQKQEHETESKKEPKDVPVSGKLLLLPTIATIGIVSAIDIGFCTQASVGKFSSGEALVPGNIVALHSYNNGTFVRVYNDNDVECGGDSRSRKTLPFDWDS